MEYVNFGRSGLKVSRLAYGLGLRGQDDPGEAERAIERGIELGINFIDCANIYGLGDGYETRGTSEQLLARVLKRHRDDLVVTSKVASRINEGPNDAGLSRYHIMREIDRTLARLETDHIDIYILHVYDEETPLEETLRALDGRRARRQDPLRGRLQLPGLAGAQGAVDPGPPRARPPDLHPEPLQPPQPRAGAGDVAGAAGPGVRGHDLQPPRGGPAFGCVHPGAASA